MSIKNIVIQEYPQKFDVPSEYKIQYGEVSTDFRLIKNILDLIPISQFSNLQARWLDPCCGRGYFMIYLYKKLFEGLKFIFPDENMRHNHIIENMLFMVELNGDYIPELRTIFGKNANIFHEDFLAVERKGFDFIVGNPPFNVGGLVKVPTNKAIDKRGDGKSVWMHFINKSIDALCKKGTLAMITPSIWLKRDHSMHKVITRYHIRKLHTLTSNETNRIFHGYAQTPTCYFTLIKIRNRKNVANLYDKTYHKYIKFKIDTSIPLCGASILTKLQQHLRKLGPVVVKKTNMPHPSINFSDTESEIFPHSNIKTCHIKNKTTPQLVTNYSNKSCVFSNTKKLVLAHKMYGFPFYDINGDYGISNRDNYVIYGKTDREFRILKAYLSTKLALFLFSTTRYRMKYLEKYIFEMIPDISKDMDVEPEQINEKWVSDYFGLEEIERLVIKNHSKRHYLSFS